ncbi:efflux RND transporter periplasmic adaptor subunit [bacterium]|nr:efflux RND transporter periplasmic adaptor subunit [bacterium]
MKRIVLVLLLIFLVGLTAFRVYEEVSLKEKLAKEEKAAIPVKVVHPTKGKFSYQLHFTGNVLPDKQVNVYPEVAGKIEKFLVNEGELVVKDEVIAYISKDIPGMKYERAKLRSPITGIIAQLNLDAGSYVAPQVPVASVIKMNIVKVSFSVPEKKILELHGVKQVNISVDAYPDTVFIGRITNISPVVDPMSRSVKVECMVRNKDYLLKPGMFARVTLPTVTKENVLILPQNAVVRNLETGEIYAFTVKNNIAHKKMLKLGLENEDSVEVISGVSADDLVVSRGNYYLSDGATVEIVE